MAQYCKYCAHCIEGDCYYCTAKEEVLGDKKIHYTNKCKEYVESELGSIIDGRKYKPRRKKVILCIDGCEKEYYEDQVGVQQSFWQNQSELNELMRRDE